MRKNKTKKKRNKEKRSQEEDEGEGVGGRPQTTECTLQAKDLYYTPVERETSEEDV